MVVVYTNSNIKSVSFKKNERKFRYYENYFIVVFFSMAILNSILFRLNIIRQRIKKIFLDKSSKFIIGSVIIFCGFYLLFTAAITYYSKYSYEKNIKSHNLKEIQEIKTLLEKFIQFDENLTMPSDDEIIDNFNLFKVFLEKSKINDQNLVFGLNNKDFMENPQTKEIIKNLLENLFILKKGKRIETNKKINFLELIKGIQNFEVLNINGKNEKKIYFQKRGSSNKIPITIKESQKVKEFFGESINSSYKEFKDFYNSILDKGFWLDPFTKKLLFVEFKEKELDETNKEDFENVKNNLIDVIYKKIKKIFIENFAEIIFNEKQIFQNQEEIEKILNDENFKNNELKKIIEREIYTLLCEKESSSKKSIIDANLLRKVIAKLIIYKINLDHKEILKNKDQKDIFEIFPIHILNSSLYYSNVFEIEYQRYQDPASDLNESKVDKSVRSNNTQTK